MKLDITAFTASFTILAAAFSFILFVWCSANGFGSPVVLLFESIHPSGGFSIIEHIRDPFYTKIPGIIINTVYAAFDAFIVSLLFSFLYNTIITRTRKKR